MKDENSRLTGSGAGMGRVGFEAKAFPFPFVLAL